MTIEAGKSLGNYKVVSAIGAGGMGEVYRAHDSRLDREVAIKLLPADFANDADRLRRFEQEAKATSALNHPNILTVYDIGEHEGSPFIVSELLDGEELRDRLDEAPIPLRKVIEYTQQIISGLAAAHEKGIVHRDLKPENLFITRNDRIKILDFGLAKLRGNSGEAHGSEDATRKAITNPGVVMGTVGYMSPEQVRGQTTDHRSDIFSFGAILHEMITGRRAFRRETMAETMTAILKEEPEELDETNPNISPALVRIVHRCLEKKPERRFQSTSDLGFALESLSAPTSLSGSSASALTTAASAAVEEKKKSVWRERLPWIVAGAMTVFAVVAFGLMYLGRSSTPDHAIWLSFAPPQNLAFNDKKNDFAVISPDGQKMAFTAYAADGKSILYVSDLNSHDVRPLPGTDNAIEPFWSPDSRSIAFGSMGKLKKTDISGGNSQTLCDAARMTGGAWSKKGVIVFGPDYGSALFQVPSTGGEPKPVTVQAADGSEGMHRHPNFLPDGAHFLFVRNGGTWAGSLDSRDVKQILPEQTSAIYSSGMLVYVRNQVLVAQAFDAGNADHRSDIFSFGAILHEMITGRRAFRRETMAETMTAILKEEAEELSASNPNINPSLERIVNRCLEKKPERRFQSTADLSFALEALSAPTNSSGSGLTTAAAVAVAETKRSVWRERVPWIATAIFFLSFLAALPFAIKYFRQPTPAQPVAASFLITPPGAATAEKSTGFSQIAISPDGRNLVFNTSIDGQNEMWIRPLNSTTPKRLAGTEGANGFMFWSPDSRSVVFLAAGKIKKIDIVAGLVQEICDFAADRRGFGGSWSRDGTIIFSMGGLGIYRVPASGGKSTAIPGFEKSEEVLKRWPQFLPDSRHFLYLATTALKNSSEVMVGSIDGGEPKRLFPSTSNALYAPSLNGVDHIVFSRGGALLAQSFDADNLVLIGEPSRVADQVRINSNSHAFVSVSDNGTLVFDPSSDLENRQLTWFDRSGKQLETVGPIGSYLRARLSPDQKRIAVARRDPGAGVFDIYVYDIARGTSSRVTTSNSDVESLAWSPDGNYIVWSSRQVTKSEMYRKLASGAGEVEVIAQSNNPIGITDWSKDGKFILYTDADPTTNLNLWVLPLEGERKPNVYFQTPDEDGNGRFSPDGRFIVYRSRESGTNEIYVQTFPASGMKLPISTNGGTNPVWAPSGKELFFIAPDGKLMSLDIGAGSSFEPGKPKVLFDIIAARTNQGNDYDVSTDGQRFLFISRMADATSSLAVVINWTADLKK